MTTAQPLRKLGAAARATKDAKPVVSSVRWSLEWVYFVAVMAAWCFVPLLRRLLDWHNGFYNPVQIISTIPYALTIPFIFVCFRPERLARLTPAFKLFAGVWIGAFAYGLLIAAAVGNTFAGVYETVQYLVPMLAGLWLAGSDLDDLLLMRRLTKIVLIFGAVVAGYGIVQWIAPPPWDVLWIQGGKYISMGEPVPYGLRIFSTLNSAGPAADFFAIMLILALPFCRLKNVWVWPFVTLLGGALLITLVRSSWIALIIGVGVYLFVSPARMRTIPFIALYAVVLSFLVATLPALLGSNRNNDVITARIATLGDISHDNSALARTIEIETALQQGLANPIGEGLGQIGASAALSANPESPNGNVLDSGYLSRFLELGWLGFSAYAFVVFGSLATMLAMILRPVGGPKSREVVLIASAAAGMCAALLWADAAGDAHLGIDGLFFWMALGIGLRRMPSATP
jgi:putative inorganic carbon (hco3(-)) transporter